MQISLETSQTPSLRREKTSAKHLRLLHGHAKNKRSTEAEIISLDGSLRMDGITALSLWDTVMDVSDPQQCLKQSTPKKQVGHNGLFGDFHVL